MTTGVRLVELVNTTKQDMKQYHSMIVLKIGMVQVKQWRLIWLSQWLMNLKIMDTRFKVYNLIFSIYFEKDNYTD